ncbi:MAG: outer membrane beta-barrel domain-containing protein [Gammaproteobacteria bacterium]|nr:outer membrane beta-barrel domain-containing protein [Gammaproteobacteria bacterium]
MLNQGICKILTLVLVIGFFASGCSVLSSRDKQDEKQELPMEEAPGQVIAPDVERRDISVPKIDTENWEIGLYVGVLSVDDFGSRAIYGVRAAYHVSEDFFLEGAYARSTVEDTNFRDIGLPIFPNEEEDLNFYSFSLGYNFLPGEVFVGTKWAMTSSMYFIFGVGNTEFIGEDDLTYSLGFGLRVLPRDYLTLRIEAKDNIFESDLLGTNDYKHNLEFNIGFSVFF